MTLDSLGEQERGEPWGENPAGSRAVPRPSGLREQEGKDGSSASTGGRRGEHTEAAIWFASGKMREFPSLSLLLFCLVNCDVRSSCRE